MGGFLIWHTLAAQTAIYAFSQAVSCGAMQNILLSYVINANQFMN